MAPTHIENVVINLAAADLRKLNQLKSVDCADLIVARKQVAVPALNRDLIAVDQKSRGVARDGVVVEMSIAESAGHGERGAWTNRLNYIENRRVRQPGNVSDRTELTLAEEVAARQTTTLLSRAHATQGKTEPRDTAKACLEGTVGQVGEGVAQSSLAGSPARDSFQADGLQLPHVTRIAVERSAAEVLQKQIALGPELLEVERPENPGDRL